MSKVINASNVSKKTRVSKKARVSKKPKVAKKTNARNVPKEANRVNNEDKKGFPRGSVGYFWAPDHPYLNRAICFDGNLSFVKRAYNFYLKNEFSVCGYGDFSYMNKCLNPLTHGCPTFHSDDYKMTHYGGKYVDPYTGKLYVEGSTIIGDGPLSMYYKNRVSHGYPLHVAAREGHAPIIEFILANKQGKEAADIVDINCVDDLGLTPLYYAYYYKHRSCVDLLLNAGATTDCILNVAQHIYRKWRVNVPLQIQEAIVEMLM